MVRGAGGERIVYSEEQAAAIYIAILFGHIAIQTCMGYTEIDERMDRDIDGKIRKVIQHVQLVFDHTRCRTAYTLSTRPP